MYFVFYFVQNMYTPNITLGIQIHTFVSNKKNVSEELIEALLVSTQNICQYFEEDG